MPAFLQCSLCGILLNIESNLEIETKNGRPSRYNGTFSSLMSSDLRLEKFWLNVSLSIADLSTADFCPVNGHSFIHIVNTVYMKLNEALNLRVFFIIQIHIRASIHIA